METLQELQELYKESSDEVKNEAWERRGITGRYFRQIVKGVDTYGKPISEDKILGCYNALKLAAKIVAKRNYEKAQEL